MSEGSGGESSQGGQDLDGGGFAEAGRSQADASEGSVEGVLPADNQNADDDQGENAAPAVLLVTVIVEVKSVFGGGKPSAVTAA